MKNSLYISFVYLLLCVHFSSFGQTQKQLEKIREKLKTEIKKVNSLLFETKKKKNNALDDLIDLNQKIQVREQLIRTIHLELKILSKEIVSNKKKLAKLNKNLSDLKADYSSMIFKSYKSKSQQSKIMFLLSSKNFHQAYKRLQYIKQYTSFRKKQGEQIVYQANIIQKFTDSLLVKKQKKNTLIVVENKQKNKLEVDKKNQKKLLLIIKKKEKKYKQELLKKQQEELKITSKIDQIIKQAITYSNKNRKKGVEKSKGFILSPQAKALAIKFEQNKGKLPWPVKQGIITRKFGIQPHPTIRGITINSTGLHIVTKKGSRAKCIFNGKVLAVQLLSEGKKAVLVQHGNYITAYNNLEKVYVEKGQTVTTGQNLGEIFTDKIIGKTKLIFVIYKNTKRLNPSSWILSR